MSTAPLPDRAHVVIVGGGVIGTSVAYHLTKLGYTDILLLEQGQLSSGTTWHAAGLVGQLRASESGTRLVQYSTQLYTELEREVGLSAGYKQCGGVTVARTEDRMVQLRRTAANAAAFDLECELLTPEQALERYPIMRVDDLVGAIWLPADGKANPTDLTGALAKGARMRGTRIIEHIRVLEVLTAGGRVTGVRTDAGDIEAEIVVNCAGQWAKQVGAMAGVNVPLHSAEHFYVVTDTIEGVHTDLPILRDPDGYTYFKEEVGGLVIGGFEPEAKPWVSPDKIPYPFEFQLLEEDWDHFEILMNSALLRIPALSETGIKKFYNGPESFTPDNQFILGEAPELVNFFVGAGFNSVGIATAGGAGRALAEWIVNGTPTSDLTGVDIRRFAPFNGNVQWLHDRVGEVLGLHYEIPWPNREMSTHGLSGDRPSITSSRSQRELRERDGMGTGQLLRPAKLQTEDRVLLGKPNWLAGRLESRSTPAPTSRFSTKPHSRSTSWSAMTPKGLCSGYAPQTWRRGREVRLHRDAELPRHLRVGCDCHPHRQERIPDRLQRGHHGARQGPHPQKLARRDSSNPLGRDSVLAVFGVMGPRSRELLERLTPGDISNEGFPFGTSQQISLGYSTVRATRITYVGELGGSSMFPQNSQSEPIRICWRPAASSASAWGLLRDRVDAAREGLSCVRTELTPDYSPVEAGLLFACKLKTDVPFLGREALKKAKAEGPLRKLVGFSVNSAEPMLWGGELILRDGVVAGQVTSAAWGETVGSCVGLAYVRAPDYVTISADWINAGTYQVNVGGDIYPISVSLKAIYDPTNEKIR